MKWRKPSLSKNEKEYLKWIDELNKLIWQIATRATFELEKTGAKNETKSRLRK